MLDAVLEYWRQLAAVFGLPFTAAVASSPAVAAAPAPQPPAPSTVSRPLKCALCDVRWDAPAGGDVCFVCGQPGEAR